MGARSARTDVNADSVEGQEPGWCGIELAPIQGSAQSAVHGLRQNFDSRRRRLGYGGMSANSSIGPLMPSTASPLAGLFFISKALVNIEGRNSAEEGYSLRPD